MMTTLLLATLASPLPQAVRLTPERRSHYIRGAQVWTPIDIPSLDLLAGASSFEDAIPFEAEVKCNLVKRKKSDVSFGSTSKFRCERDNGDVMKVRFDADNGEVFASVGASRLFWALGFGAERFYPAKVICRDCPEDPWDNPDGEVDRRTFHPAIVERKFAKTVFEVNPEGKPDGWSWEELANVDEDAGGAPLAHLDALKLLSALVQHGDNRGIQQYLVCLNGTMDEEGNCGKPFLFVHDLGTAFGESTWEIDEHSKMNFKRWASVPVWRDKKNCVAQLSAAYDGTLRHPKISEEGRSFLAGLLDQLSDRQILDLFRAARPELRDGSSAEDWARVFKKKRREIVGHQCP